MRAFGWERREHRFLNAVDDDSGGIAIVGLKPLERFAAFGCQQTVSALGYMRKTEKPVGARKHSNFAGVFIGFYELHQGSVQRAVAEMVDHYAADFEFVNWRGLAGGKPGKEKQKTDLH